MEFANLKTKKWSILIWLAMLFCFYLNNINDLNAAENQKVPVVSDPANILQTTTFEHITQFLEGVTHKRNISLWVFVLKDDSGVPLSTIAHEKIAKFEHDYPQIKALSRRASLFVNVDTHESWIILGDDFIKENGFMEGIYAIHQEIIFPNLVNHQVDKALWEGTVALGMALEEFARPVNAFTLIQDVDKWLSEHHFVSLWSLCKWIFSLSFCLFIFNWMKKLFHRPHWEETLDKELLASLPENLSLYDLTSLMMALKKDKELGN